MPHMEIAELKVVGMTCSGCVRSVTRALTNVAGVATVDVSLDQALARVTFDPAKVNRSAIRAAVVEAGFDSPEV
jgi:copper chaperone